MSLYNCTYSIIIMDSGIYFINDMYIINDEDIKDPTVLGPKAVIYNIDAESYSEVKPLHLKCIWKDSVLKKICYLENGDLYIDSHYFILLLNELNTSKVYKLGFTKKLTGKNYQRNVMNTNNYNKKCLTSNYLNNKTTSCVESDNISTLSINSSKETQTSQSCCKTVYSLIPLPLCEAQHSSNGPAYLALGKQLDMCLPTLIVHIGPCLLIPIDKM